jgi:hypothetical protein
MTALVPHRAIAALKLPKQVSILISVARAIFSPTPTLPQSAQPSSTSKPPKRRP